MAGDASDCGAEEEAYHELCAYTLGRGDPEFIHQHVVDAWAAQHATVHTKPIGVTFALVGLYLSVERAWSGRQVQRAHMELGKRKRTWPTFDLPAARGAMTAIDVMNAAEGSDRDEAIGAWCLSVWQAYADSRSRVIELLAEYGV